MEYQIGKGSTFLYVVRTLVSCHTIRTSTVTPMNELVDCVVLHLNGLTARALLVGSAVIVKHLVLSGYVREVREVVNNLVHMT